MKSFRDGQRVMVRQNEDGRDIHAAGVVKRIRRDGGAWIALDKRSEAEGVHPFDADDPTRSTHVAAFPDDCDLV